MSFSQIETFDKKRWDKKGIAKIRYTQEGKRQTFVLDDCNYDYQPIRAMVRLVESKIDRKQIVGGEPEPPEKPQKKGMANCHGSSLRGGVWGRNDHRGGLV